MNSGRAAALQIYSGRPLVVTETKQNIKVDDEVVKKCIQDTYKTHDVTLKTFVNRFTKEINKLKHDISSLKKTNKSLVDKIQMLEDSMKPLSDNSDFNEMSESESEEAVAPNSATKTKVIAKPKAAPRKIKTKN